MPESQNKLSASAVVGVIGCAVGVAGALFGFWQARIAQEANDRAAGRVAAKLEIVRMEPPSKSLKHLFEKVHPVIPEEAPHFKTVEDFAPLNPGVLVKNTGDEIIDGLRVETQERFVADLDPGGKAEHVPFYKPNLEPSQREDYVLSEKFKPGDTAFIPIGKPLLKSILQAQQNPKYNGKHFAFFEVRCYGKAAGSPAFERAEKDENIHLLFCWYPSGFTEENCKRYTEMTPTVRIGPAQKPVGIR